MKVGIIDGRLACWTGLASRERLKIIPGALWSKRWGCWTYPLAYPSAVALGEAAKDLHETVIPDATTAEWVIGERAAWEGLAAESSKITAEAPGVPGWFLHQVQGAKWMAMPGAAGGRLDTGETGSGKTRTALRAMWHIWCNGERGIALVSTLVSVKSGWASEVEAVKAEMPLPGAEWRVFTVTGTITKRRKILAEAVAANEESGGVGVVVIMNHELLALHSRLAGWGSIALRRCPKHGGIKEGDVVKESHCQAHPKELNAMPLAVVVLDEVHRMMDPTSQVTRAAWYVCDRAPRVWGLTGTPGSRNVMENTWALLRLVYGDEWPPKESWIGYFAQAGYNMDGYWEVGGLRPEREAEFRLGYGAITRRILKAQVLDLPPLLRGGPLERIIPMSTAQRASYNAMRDHLWAESESGKITASNVLVQAGRLTLMASTSGKRGKVTIDPDGVVHEEMDLEFPSNKIDAVLDMLASGDLEEGTVFQFVSSRLMFMLRDKMVEKKLIRNAEHFGMIASGVSEAARTFARERFQAGRIPYFGFTTKAGGAGITLTRAHTMVAVQRPWSSIEHLQARDRVHRIGSEIHESVSIIDLVSEETIEFKQMERLASNLEALEDVVNDVERMKEMMFG